MGTEHAVTPVVHVVTHVHWDREWYRPFEHFRALLAELIHAVCDQLDAGTLNHFLLDGQTIALADHLAVHPGDEDRLVALISQGRLTIGPWHVLADMTLVSGEALIRNLLVGRRWMRRMGGGNDVGYCPDMFGHPPDLPTILAGFDLDTAVVWRGAPDLPRFRWRAPSEAEVLAIRSRYYEPEVLWDLDGVAGRFERWLARRRREDPHGPWLLLNGGDHLSPRDLAPRLAALDAAVPVVEATLSEHAAAVDPTDLPVVKGALRHTGTDGAFLLAGTLSTRPTLKQANAHAQALLEHWVEPLVVAATRTPEPPAGAADGQASDAELRGLLRHAWEELLTNQPHDSISGCSTDEVHAENAVRYARVTQVGEYLITRCWRRLGLATRLPTAPPEDVAYLVVHNPHARAVTAGVVVDLLVAPDRAPVTIAGPRGPVVHWSATDLGVEEAFETDVDTVPRWPRVQRWQLHLLTRDLPPSGWCGYRVMLGDALPAAAVRTVDGGSTIADGGWTISAADDGTVTVATPGGRRLAGLGRLDDEGDAGDTYNADIVGPVVGARLRDVAVSRSASDQRLRLHCTLTLPGCLTGDRRRRGAETIETPVDIEVVKWRGVEELEWHVAVDNSACDHRLRIAFPTDLSTTTWAGDSAFSWSEHPIAKGPPDPVSGPGVEQDPQTAPLQRWIATGGPDDRIAVVTSGLHEGTGRRGANATSELGLTLIRSVGWLGRFDLRTRTMGAGPPLEVPEAQARGPHRFVLALRLGDDDFDLAAAAERWRAPPRAVQTFDEPRSRAGLSVHGALVSADKPAEEGDDRILRVWNPTPQPTTAEIHLDSHAPRVHDSDLDERDGPPRTTVDGRVGVRLGPFGLHTLRVPRTPQR